MTDGGSGRARGSREGMLPTTVPASAGGASVYRVPVDDTALVWQLVDELEDEADSERQARIARFTRRSPVQPKSPDRAKSSQSATSVSPRPK